MAPKIPALITSSGEQIPPEAIIWVSLVRASRASNIDSRVVCPHWSRKLKSAVWFRRSSMAAKLVPPRPLTLIMETPIDCSWLIVELSMPKPTSLTMTGILRWLTRDSILVSQ